MIQVDTLVVAADAPAIEVAFKSAALIVALIAAIGAWIAAHATKRASQGSLIAGLVDSYFTPEMLRAMHELTGFEKEHGDQLANVFARLRGDRKTYPQVTAVDEARRLYKGYFVKVYRLAKQESLLSKSQVETIIVERQVEFLRKYVEPLDYIIDPQKHDKEIYDYFGDLYAIERRNLPVVAP